MSQGGLVNKFTRLSLDGRYLDTDSDVVRAVFSYDFCKLIHVFLFFYWGSLILMYALFTEIIVWEPFINTTVIDIYKRVTQSRSLKHQMQTR